MRLICLLLVMFGGCLSGCAIKPMTADELFGGASQAPKLKITKTWTGFSAEAGTNFEGSLNAKYIPETGEFNLDGKVSSGASDVLKEYPNWIGSMLPAQQAMLQANVEINRLQVEKHRLVGENVKAVGQMLAMAAAAGGDAFAKMVDSTAPILRGAGVSLEGLGAFNLGPVAPVVEPVPPIP